MHNSKNGSVIFALHYNAEPKAMSPLVLFSLCLWNNMAMCQTPTAYEADTIPLELLFKHVHVYMRNS